MDICFKIAAGTICEYGDAKCKYNHDLKSYLDAKPPDLRMPSVAEFLDGDGTEAAPMVCPVFEEFGECKYGFKCRYLSAHIRKTEDGDGIPSLAVDEEKKAHAAVSAKEMNYIGGET
jgi:tRNA-dihydrouridine synthase 3